MTSLRHILLTSVAALTTCGVAQAALPVQHIDFDKINFTTTQLAPNVYALTGSPGMDPSHPDAAGGRVGVLVGPQGVLVVDASYAQLSGKLLATIKAISPEPVRYLVNTHLHRDHTGGSGNIVKAGALLFAREEERNELSDQFASAAEGTSADSLARLPTVTYGAGAPVKIRMNGEIIDLIPVQPAHTGGDTIVRFENANVIMTGDFFRNYGYPYIDVENGGTVEGMLEALDQTAELAGPDTLLVPGHGTVFHRSDIAAYREMIVTVEERVRRLIATGNSRADVIAAKITAPYDSKIPGGLDHQPDGTGTSADRFVAEVFDQLQRGG
ncbi:MBL fold metallo-hydrolase [Pseudomonas sp. NPDC088368]|jgi:glyoxylase-like metal-dependent hydrolase (beta-lactamase superfamily II)|uniref:MBL fold metallo-hydrolase n=1 Tax=Pseudomonas sp. NPDC088368 TaxID=3364453 RepID=UPI00381EEFEA